MAKNGPITAYINKVLIIKLNAVKSNGVSWDTIRIVYLDYCIANRIVSPCPSQYASLVKDSIAWEFSQITTVTGILHMI